MFSCKFCEFLKFCENLFAYAVVKGSAWNFVCGVTIHPLIIGGLIAKRNGILVESLLREE